MLIVRFVQNHLKILNICMLFFQSNWKYDWNHSDCNFHLIILSRLNAHQVFNIIKLTILRYTFNSIERTTYNELSKKRKKKCNRKCIWKERRYYGCVGSSDDCVFILRNKQRLQSYHWQYCRKFLFIHTITLFVQLHAE